MSSADEKKIVERILDGDKDAFGILVERYQRQIFNMMYRSCNSFEEAADLTQDSFLKAYSNLKQFDTTKSFFTWIYSIAINHARDYSRKQKRSITIADTDWNQVLETTQVDKTHERMEDRIEIERLFKMIRLLPLDYREAIILRYKEQMSFDEIAQIIGISTSGVKMRIHRGLIKLRELLQELE